MRSFKLFALFVLFIMSFIACQDNKKHSQNQSIDSIDEQKVEFSDSDKTQVYELSNEFIQLLKQQKYDEAVEMLWYWDNDMQWVDKLTSKQAEEQKRILKRFQGVDYKLAEVFFDNEMNCRVTYTVVLFDKEQNDPTPNTITLALNPIRRSGRWFLTIPRTFVADHK